MNVEKGSIVYLSYKLYSNKKLIDESKTNLLLEYGKTIINKNLEKKLLGKTVGDIIELKQKLKTNAPTIEFDISSFDDETAEEFKENHIIEIIIKDKKNLFLVEKLEPENDKVFLKFQNPFENKVLINKIKIEKIEKKK